MGSIRRYRRTYRTNTGEYLEKFVYNQDFINADEVLYDQYSQRGNTINNVFEAYTDAYVLEYHFRGFDPNYEGMDWESLKLVFEQNDGHWYLTGIVHDHDHIAAYLSPSWYTWSVL